MVENSQIIDSIPANFDTIAEAAEFWDTHDLGDYWDETSEVDFAVRLPEQRTVALAAHIAERIAKQAQREGISVETLVNLWLSDRLQISA